MSTEKDKRPSEIVLRSEKLQELATKVRADQKDFVKVHWAHPAIPQSSSFVVLVAVISTSVPYPKAIEELQGELEAAGLPRNLSGDPVIPAIHSVRTDQEIKALPAYRVLLPKDQQEKARCQERSFLDRQIPLEEEQRRQADMVEWLRELLQKWFKVQQ